MFDMQAIVQTLGINPGWIGVVLGVILFLMGRHSGLQTGVARGGTAMIDMLEDNGFLKVKSRKTDEAGNAIVEYSKVDE